MLTLSVRQSSTYLWKLCGVGPMTMDSSPGCAYQLGVFRGKGETIQGVLIHLVSPLLHTCCLELPSGPTNLLPAVLAMTNIHPHIECGMVLVNDRLPFLDPVALQLGWNQEQIEPAFGLEVAGWTPCRAGAGYREFLL